MTGGDRLTASLSEMMSTSVPKGEEINAIHKLTTLQSHHPCSSLNLLLMIRATASLDTPNFSLSTAWLNVLGSD